MILRYRFEFTCCGYTHLHTRPLRSEPARRAEPLVVCRRIGSIPFIDIVSLRCRPLPGSGRRQAQPSAVFFSVSRCGNRIKHTTHNVSSVTSDVCYGRPWRFNTVTNQPHVGRLACIGDRSAAIRQRMRIGDARAASGYSCLSPGSRSWHLPTPMPMC